MDDKKLEHLRARYGHTLGGEMYDPHFNAVAKLSLIHI